jgi:hypothetical protein
MLVLHRLLVFVPHRLDAVCTWKNLRSLEYRQKKRTQTFLSSGQEQSACAVGVSLSGTTRVFNVHVDTPACQSSMLNSTRRL